MYKFVKNVKTFKTPEYIRCECNQRIL